MGLTLPKDTNQQTCEGGVDLLVPNNVELLMQLDSGQFLERSCRETRDY
jgi:hypothetical protein